MTQIIPVILSGGSGTRLWPLSRNCFPKQFLDLLDGTSLYQATLERVQAVSDAPPIIVTNEEHRFLVAEQTLQMGVKPEAIMLEPVARNTAPAIAVAALKALADHPGESPQILVLPADHNIVDVAGFASTVMKGSEAADTGQLITFGIVPSHPETGYGYIRSGDTISGAVRQVAEFVEKPDLATATSYVDSGDYFWNSGMFLFRADRLLEELETYQPKMIEACRTAVEKGTEDLDFFRLDKDAFGESPEDSIDYAVMEKTDNACVIPMSAGWSDVGAWPALAEINEANADNNVLRGDVLTHDSNNCMVHAESRLVAAVGVDNLVVVETPDAILVSTKDRAQDVKAIVNQLKAEDRSEATMHREMYRPWGKYDSVDAGERFQVKRITVKPGAELSLQMHHHRAEHWIVVSGTAEVTCDDSITTLTENQSTYIPLGSVHRLANRGKIPLEIIEVQSGSYLGEDDIVRYSDNYGRQNDQ